MSTSTSNRKTLGLLFSKLFLLFGTFALMIAGTNLSVDRINFFDATYERNIVRALTNGRSVYLGPDLNLDLRWMTRIWIQELKVSPEIVLISGSPLSEVDHSYFYSRDLIHHWVPYFQWSDLEHFMGLYRDRKIIPKTLVLEIPNRFFSEANAVDEKDHYSRWLRVGQIEHYLRFFSIRFFRQSLFEIRNPGSTYPEMEVDPPADQSGWIVHPGGIWQRNRTAPIEYRGQLVKPSFRYSASKVEALGRLANEMIGLGTKSVIFVIAPLRDDYYQYDRKLMEDRIQTEDHLRRIANQSESVMLLGSWDTNRIPCKRGEFIDVFHSKRSCLKRFFEVPRPKNE